MAASRFSAYIFTTIAGKPYSIAKINRSFSRAKVLVGIERRCRFKDLRHPFGSNLASRGVSLQKIAKAMGQASARTMERYAKVSEESMREIASALASVTSALFFGLFEGRERRPGAASLFE